MELRKGERGNRNIAALLILSLQALLKLGILDVCLSISKHSPLKINIILEEDYILDVCLSASIHPLKLKSQKTRICLSESVCLCQVSHNTSKHNNYSHDYIFLDWTRFLSLLVFLGLSFLLEMKGKTKFVHSSSMEEVWINSNTPPWRGNEAGSFGTVVGTEL